MSFVFNKGVLYYIEVSFAKVQKIIGSREGNCKQRHQKDTFKGTVQRFFTVTGGPFWTDPCYNEIDRSGSKIENK